MHFVSTGDSAPGRLPHLRRAGVGRLPLRARQPDGVHGAPPLLRRARGRRGRGRGRGGAAGGRRRPLPGGGERGAARQVDRRHREVRPQSGQGSFRCVKTTVIFETVFYLQC